MPDAALRSTHKNSLACNQLRLRNAKASDQRINARSHSGFKGHAVRQSDYVIFADDYLLSIAARLHPGEHASITPSRIHIRPYRRDDTRNLDPRDKICRHELPHDQVDAPNANRAHIDDYLAGTGSRRRDVHGYEFCLRPFGNDGSHVCFSFERHTRYQLYSVY